MGNECKSDKISRKARIPVLMVLLRAQLSEPRKRDGEEQQRSLLRLIDWRMDSLP